MKTLKLIAQVITALGALVEFLAKKYQEQRVKEVARAIEKEVAATSMPALDERMRKYQRD